MFSVYILNFQRVRWQTSSTFTMISSVMRTRCSETLKLSSMRVRCLQISRPCYTSILTVVTVVEFSVHPFCSYEHDMRNAFKYVINIHLEPVDELILNSKKAFVAKTQELVHL